MLIKDAGAVVIENSNLQKGDKVAFQYFGNEANYHPFRDDSETLTIGVNFVREYINTNEAGAVYTAFDYELHRVVDLSFPYAYDSETFGCIPIARARINTRCADCCDGRGETGSGSCAVVQSCYRRRRRMESVGGRHAVAAAQHCRPLLSPRQ